MNAFTALAVITIFTDVCVIVAAVPAVMYFVCLFHSSRVETVCNKVRHDESRVNHRGLIQSVISLWLVFESAWVGEASIFDKVDSVDWCCVIHCWKT